MTRVTVEMALAASQEFERRARRYLKELPPGYTYFVVGTRVSGALRRQSMELTRALADLRHPA